LTREKILDAWKARWERTLDEKFLSVETGKLLAKHEESFLEKNEVYELQGFGERVVKEAIGKHQKLKKILGEAQSSGYYETARKPPWRDATIPKTR
jgi:hypothetical protein